MGDENEARTGRPARRPAGRAPRIESAQGAAPKGARAAASKSAKGTASASASKGAKKGAAVKSRAAAVDDAPPARKAATRKKAAADTPEPAPKRKPASKEAVAAKPRRAVARTEDVAAEPRASRARAEAAEPARKAPARRASAKSAEPAVAPHVPAWAEETLPARRRADASDLRPRAAASSAPSTGEAPPRAARPSAAGARPEQPARSEASPPSRAATPPSAAPPSDAPPRMTWRDRIGAHRSADRPPREERSASPDVARRADQPDPPLRREPGERPWSDARRVEARDDRSAGGGRSERDRGHGDGAGRRDDLPHRERGFRRDEGVQEPGFRRDRPAGEAGDASLQPAEGGRAGRRRRRRRRGAGGEAGGPVPQAHPQAPRPQSPPPSRPAPEGDGDPHRARWGEGDEGGGRRRRRRRRRGGGGGGGEMRQPPPPQPERQPFVPQERRERDWNQGFGGGGGDFGGGGRRKRRRGRDGGGWEPRPAAGPANLLPERDPFTELTSIDPDERIDLETDTDETSMRVVDLISPIGKGQRALIVAPPKTGKTTLLMQLARAISENHPEVELLVMLVDERPEEVTAFRRAGYGTVLASSNDEPTRRHLQLTQHVLDLAKGMVLEGKDVCILLDSITRMARAHNVAAGGGRTLSGGLDSRALERPKRFFGAARKIAEGGSLTILATALIDTGSRMDEVIFQEFKGTGNSELQLDRRLAERRIWPAIDIVRSGTRKEEKLFEPAEFEGIVALRRALSGKPPAEAMQMLLNLLKQYRTNRELLLDVARKAASI